MFRQPTYRTNEHLICHAVAKRLSALTSKQVESAQEHAVALHVGDAMSMNTAIELAVAAAVPAGTIVLATIHGATEAVAGVVLQVTA